MGAIVGKPVDREAVKARVDDLISKNKVMVFSKPICPFCFEAKRALKQHTKNFKVLELSGREGQAIQDVMLLKTGERTVPRVFINGRCIGGGTETAAAAADGSLARLLAA